jgi:hypothetical protein
MLSLFAYRTVCVIPGCPKVEELCRLLMLLLEMSFIDLMIDVLSVSLDKASAIELSLPFKYLILKLNCLRIYIQLIGWGGVIFSLEYLVKFEWWVCTIVFPFVL